MRPTTADDNDFNALLHPGTVFEHPKDVVYHSALVPEASRPATAVRFDDIIDALKFVESEPETAVDDGEGSNQYYGRNRPDTFSIDP